MPIEPPTPSLHSDTLYSSGDQDITKDVNAVVSFLREGKPLNAENKNVFKKLEPYLANTNIVYKELAKRIDDGDFSKPSTSVENDEEKRKGLQRKVGSAIDRTHKKRDIRRTLLWKHWDRKIRV
jgi:hypothetical protein